MLEPDSLDELRTRIRQRAEEERALLDALSEEVRRLKAAVRRIYPRTRTAVYVLTHNAWTSTAILATVVSSSEIAVP